MKDKNFKILKRHNYRVLETRDFGEMVFGCPPGIVKDFTVQNRPLPNRFVIPIRTFVQGRNNFDFEFIVYSYLFIRPNQGKIIFYCTPEQKERFLIILNETLFGPRFNQIIRSQFKSLIARLDLTPKKIDRFNLFLDEVAYDDFLWGFYQSLLADHCGDKKILQRIEGYFSDLLKSQKWLPSKKGLDLRSIFSKNYLLCAQLKSEMDLFALAPEKDRKKFTQKIIQFAHFDSSGAISIQSESDSRKKIKVVQVQPSVFRIYHKRELKCEIDISVLDANPQAVKIKPMSKPFMGATFLGVGSGFAPKRHNSCVVVWSEGKGVMVDALHDSSALALGNGISEDDVECVFLTHVHSDHDLGLVETILFGKRVKIISTRIIFDSFLRKVEALTCFPSDMIESLVDFIEVEPQKKIKLPGFKNTYFTFDYSLHSIPCGRFILTYKDGKQTRAISHSGDTKFDVEKVDEWYQQGVFTKKRRDMVLGFIWDADMVIHDVGGGILHTKLESLELEKKSLGKNLVLVHQHEDPIKHKNFHFAVEGETRTLIKRKTESKNSQIETLKQVPLFNEVNQKNLMSMLKSSEVVHYNADETVFMQYDTGETFYVILEGFAEIIINGESSAIYEKGKFFGELAVNTPNPHRRATVRAMTPVTLLKIPKRFYKKLSLPNIQDDFYKIRSFYNDIISPSFIASLAFGKMTHWKKGEVIFKKGGKDRDMFIILSGDVEVLGANNKKMASLKGGDVFGELELLKNVPRATTAIAKSVEVFAIRLKKDEAYKLFKLFPSFFGTVYQKVRKIESGDFRIPETS